MCMQKNMLIICKGDLGLLGLHDGQQLLSDDGEHLNIDTVELIKAAPRPRLGQSREEATHHLQHV